MKTPVLFAEPLSAKQNQHLSQSFKQQHKHHIPTRNPKTKTVKNNNQTTGAILTFFFILGALIGFTLACLTSGTCNL